ncbi:MAG: hypothetical protein K9K82_06670 [Desulfobacteraceae bacterium]|nr:hypothetical protein [Desulfobacteraceae bacterium]
MKRLTAILVAGLFVLAPLSASAMEMMSDSNMKDVTGQAGVSIAVDDVVIYQEAIADTTYWDTDGFTEYQYSASANAGNGGLVVEGTADDGTYGVTIDYTNNTKKLITVDAIVSDNASLGHDNYTNSNLAGTFENSAADELNMTVPSFAGIDAGDGVSALSIDVGTAKTMSKGKTFNLTEGQHTNYAHDTGVRIAGVVIGLPTVEIMQFHTNDVRTVSMATRDGDAGSAMNAQGDTHSDFITIEKNGTSKMAILGGTVEIAPH